MKQYLTWKNGKPLTAEQIQEITGLTIGKPAMRARLRKAQDAGWKVDTLSEQMAVLVNQSTKRKETDNTEIDLSVDKNEASRLKTIREALLLDEKVKQAEIETKLKRKEVFYLEAITPAWSAMIISVREALRGAIPTLVDKILPCKDRDEALDRAEDELARHINRIADFDLTRELNEYEGTEEWQFTETELE